MISSSHSRPSLDSTPSQISSSDSFPFPRTPTNDMPFSMVEPPSPIILASPTKQRRIFMIPRKAPLRDMSSTATLKPNTPATPTDPAPPSKTLRRTSRLQKLKFDLSGPEKRPAIAPQIASPLPSASISISTAFLKQSTNAPTPPENPPSAAVSTYPAEATHNLSNPSLTHLPTPTLARLDHSDNGPKNPQKTPEGRDAGKGPLLQFKPRGRVMESRKRVPSTLNERSPFSPTAGFLLSTVDAGQSEPARPWHSEAVGSAAHEKGVVEHTGSSSDTPEERAHARSEWLRSLRNRTISRLRSVNGLKELNELKRNVEICERRSTERPEGAVRVRVRANNMVVGPINRTGASSSADATIGRSHPRLGSASSGSAMGVVDTRTTPLSTPSSSMHSFRAHSRTSIAFAGLPHPEAKRTPGSWSRRSSGSGSTTRPTSPSRPRRKSSLIGSIFSRPGSMSTHEEERDHGTEELETMARRTEEMMRAAVWGKSVTDKRWSGTSLRASQQYQHQHRGSQSSVNIDTNATASASRSSVDVRSTRSTSPLPLPPTMAFGQMQPVAIAAPLPRQPRRRPSRLHKKSFDWSAAGHPHPPSAYQEPVSPLTPVAPPHAHDEAARKSMGEFNEYVKTLPRNFATSYVAQLIEQGEKASTSSSASSSTAAPQKDKERRGSKMIAREVSRKISAVFVGKR
jgi:hypothetical protein